MTVFNNEIAYQRDRILSVMAWIMTSGALIGFISFVITQNDITKSLLILFTFSMIFHGTLYFLHAQLLKFNLKPKHLFTLFIYVVFTIIAIYNPFGFHYMWAYLLYFPIFISLIENEHLYKIWCLFYLVLYAIFLFSNYHGAMDKDTSLLMMVQIILATGSALVGYIMVKYVSFVRGLYIQNQEHQIKEHILGLLSTLVPIVESKTRTTKYEIVEMSELMKGIIKKLPNLEVKDWEIEILSLLHYVSRIEWPDYLFEKHETLTEYEFKIVQDHCLFGAKLLGDFQSFSTIKEAFVYHHTRKDGSGYPNNGSIREVPKLSQILGVVEAYLAMIYPRAYHSARSKEEALSEILQFESSKIDSDIIEALADVIHSRSNKSLVMVDAG